MPTQGIPLCPRHPWSLTTRFSPRSPGGSPHHPLRHPAHHHIGAHPLAGTVPAALQGVVGPATRPLGRWHRGVLGTDISGCRGAPGRSSPSVSSLRSPRPRTRSTGSCWVSASATASWCTTACAASPCAASATPAPRGLSSPVSAHGPAEPGDVWPEGGGTVVAGGGRGRAASRAPRPLPGASPDLSGSGCAPRSCHPSPGATRSVVPNTLVCDVTGSVPLCSAPVSPQQWVSVCLHLTWVSA